MCSGLGGKASMAARQVAEEQKTSVGLPNRMSASVTKIRAMFCSVASGAEAARQGQLGGKLLTFHPRQSIKRGVFVTISHPGRNLIE
jgi:hypothetical protein